MSFLRSRVFWIVVVATVGVVVAGWKVSRHFKEAGGFKDLLKNPGRWDEIAEMRANVDREVEEAKKWSDEQVARTVRHFVLEVKTSNDAWGEQRILRDLGARTHPAALAILADKSLAKRLTIPTGKALLPEAPIDRLCQVLGDRPPAEAVALLKPFAADASKEVRKEAILTIGKVGTPAVIEPVRQALTDRDEYVRSYALMGLDWAERGGYLDEQCQRDLFGDIHKAFTAGNNTDYAAKLLLDFDAARATEIFLSPAVFAPSAKGLNHALAEMSNHQIAVPRDRLLALIKELEARKMEYPHTYSLAAALRLLGRHRDTTDEPFLKARMSHSDETVAEGAATGLLAWHDLEGYDETIRKKEEAGQAESLSTPQKYLIAVEELDGEVNNGGHSQYFVNSSGDHWQEALAGLEAMGSKERTAIFREAVAKFGKGGPSANRDERGDQLAKLVRKKEDVFEALDDRYYACKEAFGVLSTQYVIKNAAAFK